jgi:hypothetical protein
LEGCINLDEEGAEGNFNKGNNKMKELEIGKNYYSIVETFKGLQVLILKEYEGDRISTYCFKYIAYKFQPEYSSRKSIYKMTLEAENIKEFIGFSEFMRDYNRAKREFIIKKIVE